MNEPSPISLVLESASPEETLAVGDALGRALSGNLIVALTGPLGAGKTQLIKGIAAGNSVQDVSKVTSPTFTLIQEYAGRFHLYHLDAYRLPNARALAALGFDELIRPDSVVLVEWADRAAELIPPDALHIGLRPIGETQRELHFSGLGAAANVISQLRTLLRATR